MALKKKSKERNFNRYIINDELFSAGLLFLVFSIISSLFNYFYHVFAGRYLGPADYGIIGSLFAVMYIITLPNSAFTKIIAKFAAEFKGKNEKGLLKYLIQRSIIKAFIYAAFCLGAYLCLTPFIASYMNLPDIYGLVIVGIVGYLSFVGSVIAGALNGLQKFVFQNVSGFVSSALKLAIAIILILIGLRVNGAMAAVAIGALISILVSIYPLRKETKKIKAEKFDTKKVYIYAIPVFIASLLPVLVITLDQILVKHFFTSENAGYYAAAGLIAKAIWFGSSFLTAPLFPKIVDLKARNKDTSIMLIKALFFTGILIVIGCVIYFIAPYFITSLLYGKEFTAFVVPLIGLFGIAMGVFSLNQIMITFNLAIEKYSFILIIVASIMIEVIGIYMFHSSLIEIVKVVLVTNLFTFIVFLIYNRKEFMKNGNLR